MSLLGHVVASSCYIVFCWCVLFYCLLLVRLVLLSFVGAFVLLSFVGASSVFLFSLYYFTPATSQGAREDKRAQNGYRG